MQIRLNTIMAHPTLGVANPGDIIDIPDADAQPMLEGGQADPVTLQHTPAATRVDGFAQSKVDRLAPSSSEADRAAMVDERNRKASGWVQQFMTGEIDEDRLVEELTALGIEPAEIEKYLPKLREEKTALDQAKADTAGAGAAEETAATDGAPEDAMQPKTRSRK